METCSECGEEWCTTHQIHNCGQEDIDGPSQEIGGAETPGTQEINSPSAIEPNSPEPISMNNDQPNESETSTPNTEPSNNSQDTGSNNPETIDLNNDQSAAPETVSPNTEPSNNSQGAGSSNPETIDLNNDQSAAPETVSPNTEPSNNSQGAGSNTPETIVPNNSQNNVPETVVPNNSQNNVPETVVPNNSQNNANSVEGSIIDVAAGTETEKQPETVLVLTETVENTGKTNNSSETYNSSGQTAGVITTSEEIPIDDDTQDYSSLAEGMIVVGFGLGGAAMAPVPVEEQLKISVPEKVTGGNSSHKMNVLTK